jgi:AraC-like DNA-binding protein
MARFGSRTIHRGSLVTIADVECAERASGAGPEEHTTEHTLVFVRAGVFVKHAPGARRDVLVAEPVHALFLNAYVPYRVSHPTDGGDACTTLRFTADAVLDVLGASEPRVEERRDTPFALSHAPLTTDALLRMRALRRAPGTLAVDEEALALLATVAHDARRAYGVPHSARRAETRRARRELVERVKERLAARPGAPHTLVDLARGVGSSPFHLTRVFRELVGMPVHQYLLRLRLTVALERLDGGDGVGSVAHAVGFSSHAHFTDAFRARFGMAPSRYLGSRRQDPEVRRRDAASGRT